MELKTTAPPVVLASRSPGLKDAMFVLGAESSTDLPKLVRSHRAGQKACPFVRDYGERLLPSLFAHLNPMSFDEANAKEVQLAEDLRASGYAVWQK